MSTVFTDEPRWIDARWARTGAQATLRDPRFRDLVAELAAPLRDVPKDELIGEDIRQHRRLNRWRNTAFGVVTMLLIGAVAAAAIAVQQRQTAIAQRDRAVASLAIIEAERGSPATAIRAALAALPASLDGTGPLNTASSALYQSLGKIQELRRFIGHEGRVATAAFSPDGRILVTGADDKTARLWDVATGKDIATLRGHEGTVKSAAFSPDGAYARHRLCRQDSQSVGGGHRQRDRRAARPRRSCVVGRVQSPWPHSCNRLIPNGAGVGGGHRQGDHRAARPQR